MPQQIFLHLKLVSPSPSPKSSKQTGVKTGESLKRAPRPSSLASPPSPHTPPQRASRGPQRHESHLGRRPIIFASHASPSRKASATRNADRGRTLPDRGRVERWAAPSDEVPGPSSSHRLRPSHRPRGSGGASSVMHGRRKRRSRRVGPADRGDLSLGWRGPGLNPTLLVGSLRGVETGRVGALRGPK